MQHDLTAFELDLNKITSLITVPQEPRAQPVRQTDRLHVTLLPKIKTHLSYTGVN